MDSREWPDRILRRGFDAIEGELDDLVGCAVWARFQPGPRGAFERAIVGHARRPPLTADSDSAWRAVRSPRVA